MLKKMQDQLINFDIHFHTKTGMLGIEIINIENKNNMTIVIKVNENNIEYPYLLHAIERNIKFFALHPTDIIGVLELLLL